MTSLAVVILTRDEQDNLPACLTSLEGLPAQLFIVDSGSKDRTLDIAQAHSASILSHAFETHSTQWQWALAQLPAGVEWILGLDADHHLTPELHSEIARLFTSEASRLSSHDGFYLNRRQIFRGRWIRHGGYYPKYLLKLFRRDRVLFDPNDLMDHHFHVSGRVARLGGDLIEDNVKERDFAFWLAKHTVYARRHAEEELLRRGMRRGWVIQPSLVGTPDQRIAWLKDRWYALPLYVRPVLYFAYRYVLRRGFLDGKQGFIFHFFQGFWYRMLVDVVLDDLLTQGRTLMDDSKPGPPAQS
jgi:glycosyltransferase involved in cell wall biosynthesis